MSSLNPTSMHDKSFNHHSPEFVAVFVGATRGIGLATLKMLARTLPAPRLCIIGRSEARFAPQLAALRESNPNATIRFVEAEVSLIKAIDDACDTVLTSDTHLDLLYMSPGSLAFGGPHYTHEELDVCFALSFYIRMRLVERLLPLLMQSTKPRVLSVLAGGHEGSLYTDDGDIGLRKKGNYTAPRAANQVTTLHSLAFMHFASQYPKVAWLHAHPGWVATNFLSDLLQSAGVMGVLVAKIVMPVYHQVAMSEDVCGQRQASYALSGRYPSRDMIRAAMVDVSNQALCHGACSGFYRVLSDGSTAIGDEVLGPLEKDEWPLKVLEHVHQVFDGILGGNKEQTD